MALPSVVSGTLILSLAVAVPVRAQPHDHGAMEKLGVVQFATSCSASAQPQFSRAVALLHSFEFARAIEGFDATLKTDPSCAMAEWGVALSRWGNPFAAGIRPGALLRQGLEAVNRGMAIGTKTPREGAYLEAVSQLFTNVETIDQPKRVLAYRDAMATLAQPTRTTPRRRSARRVLDSLPEVKARFDPEAIGSAAPGSAGVFALAVIPARYALDRGAWADAAKLQPQPSRFLYPDALTHFAKALGAARTGDLTTIRSAIDALWTIEEGLTKQNELYWAGQATIQRRGASAWLAFADDRQEDALVEMRAAATIEDATEKSAVTPGPLAPARELVGEMLLLMNRPAEALTEFEGTLKKEPNRFRALYGAAKSASLAGDGQKARTYFATLVKVCERADTPGRPELVEARRFVSSSR